EETIVSPIHLDSLYTAFVNEGNVIQRTLHYQEQPKGTVWIQEAFSADVAETVLDDTVQVMNTPQGTGYGMHRDDLTLAGKTGTAEIKDSQEDEDGTELGWL